MHFAHICPIKHLNKVASRPFHLTLAHLVESHQQYVDFYVNEKLNNPNMINIMDNGGFEMYKRGLPMYPANKLLELGNRVHANYTVLADYPAEPWQKTVEAAEELIPTFKSADMGTFFVPQSEIGDVQGLINSFEWALMHPDIDYVGMSILAIPNAYGVEKNNKLQRFFSRYWFCQTLEKQGYWERFIQTGKKLHFLGAVDGPNEIALIGQLGIPVNTWDSSAAIWAGLNGIEFDQTPTGLVNGKFEEEVDFASSISWSSKAESNMMYIDQLVKEYFNG